MKSSELAGIIGAELFGADAEITNISPIDNIKEGGLVPLLSKNIPSEVFDSQAAAFLVGADFDRTRDVPYIVCADAELALVAAVDTLYPPVRRPEGVHANADVCDSAVLGENVSVGSLAYVGENSKIGEGTQIYPSVFIGDNVTLGTDCVIYPNVSIYDGCTLGDRVIIHSGTVIGSDGFGYYQKNGTNVKIRHIGSVIIGNDVEIGSNSCVDKGKFSDTIIGDGTKIDNLVQVAHNVVLGRHNIMAGQSAISGSSKTGDYVIMGGRAAVADHVDICGKVMIAGNCGVISDIDKPGIYAGFPHNNRKAWLREVAILRDMPNVIKRIKELEKKKDD
jgi:UDP-3-O-[3-hydroxymyristoyl] glucosamine N-acyltransferase